MTARRAIPTVKDSCTIPSSPLSVGEWEQVVQSLSLSPQQARIVDLILRGLKDKHIAEQLKLSIWTVRTHLNRIFARLDVDDRVELVVRVFVCCRELQGSSRVPHGRDHFPQSRIPPVTENCDTIPCDTGNCEL